MRSIRELALLVALAASCSRCGGGGSRPAEVGAAGSPPFSSPTSSAPSGAAGASASPVARLPLELVADVALPDKPVRFDYQDIDAARGHLIIAHMNDASVVVVNLADGSVAGLLPNIPTPRGVVVGPEAGRIFVTSSPSKLVIVDSASLGEIGRVDTGKGPDGVGWDGAHQIVGVSDQGDGALSLIDQAGNGKRTQVPLGAETGNVVYDAARSVFWVTVVTGKGPDQLVSVDPLAAKVSASLALPGCQGAHGLRLHPDGQSALVACEDNAVVARVSLSGSPTVTTAPCGSGPDVMALDPALGWLYVAAETGPLTVFDLSQPGLVAIDSETPGANGHTVAVDPSTHRVFFPLPSGPSGSPVLRIMRPRGL